MIELLIGVVIGITSESIGIASYVLYKKYKAKKNIPNNDDILFTDDSISYNQQVGYMDL